MLKEIIKNQQGISNLLPVIVITAVALLLITTASLRVIDETKIGLNSEKTLDTFSATETCMETALYNLKSNTGYIGETLTFSDISCTITATGSGNTRTVNVKSSSISISTYSQEIEAEIELLPNFRISTWQEVTT